MSLNLCFIPKDSAGIISLPFTLPTEVAIKVLVADTTEERLDIIITYLLYSGYENIDRTAKLLEAYFSNPALELSLI